MKLSIFKTRFIKYLVLLSVICWFLFNYLLKTQSTIMFKYFVEKPPLYYVRAETMARLVCFDFQKKLSSPSLADIRNLIDEYNSPPSLTVDFVYQDKSGTMRSILKNVKEADLTAPEYTYPIKYRNLKGKLLVYDMNTQFRKKFEEYRRIANITRMFFILTLLLLLSTVLFREYSADIKREKHAVENEKRAAEFRSLHDSATGLCTQRYFKDLLGKEIIRSQRWKRPVSVLMCDIDYFKKFNDSYGHLAGDEALRTVAYTIKNNVRAYDIVARYGGEEFAIFFLGIDFDQAKSGAVSQKELTDKTVDIATRIKNNIEKTQIKIDHKHASVTLSIGMVIYTGGADYTAERLIGEADRALYKSKEDGRNRITLYDPAKNQFKTCS
ncbi:MAG: hypothetical protein DRP85_03400 [Candidatus Makaraimicrobium thalassicum]|nr:MAG: hypothetical protein DRP85_03400 [Candidatus Omnitrophota bacterium]